MVDPKVPGVYSNCTESVDDKGKKVLVITEPVSTDEIVQEAVATPEPIIEPTNNQPALNTSYPQPQQPNYGMPQQPNYGMPHQPNYGGKRRPRKIGGRKSKRKSSGKRKNIQSKKNRK